LIVPLTEPERRRREFAGGTPIALPDGRAWRFYTPRPVAGAVRGENGPDGPMLVWDFGADLDADTNDALGQAFQRILNKIGRANGPEERACGMLEATWFLMARNYVISQEEFEDLFLRRTKRRLCKALERLIGSICAQAAELIGREMN
jgi:hypothetical protein